MNNYFPMSEDIKALVEETLKENNPFLLDTELEFVYLGVDKQSSVIQITKSSPLVNYITKKESIVFVIIFEECFDMLDIDQQKPIITNALSSIEYNSESGKTTINNKGCEVNEGVYLKYKDKLMLSIFAGQHAVRQLEKQKKEQKKNSKKKSN
jgi:hypothetical protein